MSRTIVTDGQLGRLAVKQHELFTRVKKGVLPIEQVLVALQSVIEGRDPVIPTLNIQVYQIWKTLKLGTGLKTADDFRAAIKALDNKIGNRGNDILGKPASMASSEAGEVDLVIRSVAELGFVNSATCKQIYDRAIELGLQLCLSEVGPQLRLQYQDQPKDEWLLIAMKPICDSDNDLHVFLVEHSGDSRWLDASRGPPDYRWRADSQWVFVQPRKVTES